MRALMTVIRRLQQQGIAFLFVSHKLNEVLEISEQIIVMRNGRTVSTGPVRAYDHARLVREMTGHDIRETAYHYAADETSAPLLKVENLAVAGAPARHFAASAGG
ncbi:MAG: hypothetical protein R2911_18260 [Caldilineaceae bacterium]